LPPLTRPGHCSLCGLASVSDPCTLCELENERRIANRRARAEREALTSVERVRVRA